MLSQYNVCRKKSLDVSLKRLDEFIKDATNLKDELAEANLDDFIWEDMIEDKSETLIYALEKKAQIEGLLQRGRLLSHEEEFSGMSSLFKTIEYLELMSKDCSQIIKDCEQKDDVGPAAKRMKME